MTTVPDIPLARPIVITDAGDPRLGDYRDLKERHLNTSGRRFVAESERVVRRLFSSGLVVHSVLVTPPRLSALGDALPDGVPVYLADQPVMDQIAGFHVHRGCLAIGERPAEPSIPAGAATVVVVEDLVDVDNLGAVARNAAAFGADALALSPRCADPFYRKAIRVSLGAVFALPIVRFKDWPTDLQSLRRAGFTLLAATLQEATPLPSFVRAPGQRIALLLGSEGPGLSPDVQAACDHRLVIPMSPAADSLNVATASAVFLYHLTSSPTDPSP